jgi:hypothetical protein
MNVDFVCGSEQAHAALAAYLYGEADSAERAAVEAHLAVCAACASELASLGATRSALASWTPPHAELGFRIVSDAEARPVAAVLRPKHWWQQPLPAWAQAAAAIVIFAAGGLLGMRAGTPDSGTTPTVASAPVESAPTAAPVSAQDLAALEQRLRREMDGLRSTSQAAPVVTQATPRDDQVIQRVRALLAESEERQQREMSIRLAQVLRDVDMQRRTDLARIEDTFGEMQGVTGAELLQQREVLNYLRRVSSQRPQ